MQINILSAAQMKLLARVDLMESHFQFAEACRYSREHSDLAELAFQKYGDHGPAISGCVREHFPETLKEDLRNLARLVSEHSDRAHDCKPLRVRTRTIVALGRAVAARDGSGFYGPQNQGVK